MRRAALAQRVQIGEAGVGQKPVEGVAAGPFDEHERLAGLVAAVSTIIPADEGSGQAGVGR
jgi:hypothetical protein